MKNFRLLIRGLPVICFLVWVSSSSTVLAQDLAGPWNGTWQSGANSHRGRISATFCQSQSDQLQARFRGTFAKIIPFRYRTNLTVAHQEPGLTILSGAKRLPLSGEFRYYAEIRDGCFQGSFWSRRNHGTWVLQQQ